MDTTTATVPADPVGVVQQSCVAVFVELPGAQRAPSSVTVGVTPPPSKVVPPMQSRCPPAVEVVVTSSPVSVIDSDWASKRYPSTTATPECSLPPLEASVATRTVTRVPASERGELVGPVVHSR